VAHLELLTIKIQQMKSKELSRTALRKLYKAQYKAAYPDKVKEQQARWRKKNQVEIIGRIPYSREIEKKYCAGIPIEHNSLEKIIQWIKNLPRQKRKLIRRG
jgi:CO dehydrogenase nickel-insertion accessory protein CooC1